MSDQILQADYTWIALALTGAGIGIAYVIYIAFDIARFLGAGRAASERICMRLFLSNCRLRFQEWRSRTIDRSVVEVWRAIWKKAGTEPPLSDV